MRVKSSTIMKLLQHNDIKNYDKLLINNISKTYKKSDSTIFNGINREAKKYRGKI